MTGPLTVSGSSLTIVNNSVGSDAFSLAITTDTNRQVYHLSVSTRGFTGIGTLTPRYLLNVSSSAGSSGYLFAISTGTSDIFRVNGGGEVYAGKYYGDGSGLTSIYSTDISRVSKSGDIMFGQLTITGSSVTIVSTNVATENYSLAITTDTGRQRYHLYVSTNGFVGIGTSNPSKRLSVDGGIFTSSDVISQGIVQASTMVAQAVFLMQGLTASSGSFTASGANQYSITASSGIKINGGIVEAPYFKGDGGGLTNVAGIDSTKVAKTGDIMSGQLTISGSSLTVINSNIGNAYSMIVSTTSNPDFYQFLVSKDGNVGIGITNPSVPLDVYRQISLSTNKIEDIMMYLKSSGADSYIRFFDTGWSNGAVMGMIGGVTREFVYRSSATNLSDGAEVYRIKLNGNMGIGTTNPSERLHVGTNFMISTGTIPILYVSTITGNISISTTSASTKLFVNGGIFAVSSITANQGYYGDIAGNLNINGSKIYLSGNTGIGTTNPGAKVEVMEAGPETYTLLAGSHPTYEHDLIVTTQGKAGIGLDNTFDMPTNQLQVMGSLRIGAENYGDNFAYFLLRSSSGPSYIRWDEFAKPSKGVLGFSGGVKDLVFRNNATDLSNGTEIFRIRENLNFGIGTIGAGSLSSSTFKLAVTGSSVLDPLLISTGTQAVEEILIVKSSGAIGMGTNAPDYRLDISSALRISSFLRVGDSAEAISLEPQGTYSRISFTELRFYEQDTSTGVTLTFDNDRVGIFTVDLGTTCPLQVSTAAANTTGVWDNLSDAGLKTGIAPLTNSLEKVRKLKGVSFYWTDPAKIGAEPGEHIGLIAQEVEKVMPQWVKEDDKGYKWLSKEGIDAVLIEAIKEQQFRLQTQKKEIEKLIKKAEKLLIEKKRLAK
ncbi:MAG: tail fiber domain-containing protein [Elusimicrobia bacterium]|nr:tail fiber domain-containing protein [Elusimicrobiota bacterium]